MSFSDPNSAEQAFYDAFRQLDESAMQAVWSDSDDASCIHPGGALLQGKQDVIDSWREIFSGSKPPQVHYRLIRSNADARLAVHTVEERINSGSGDRQAIVLATNVYIYCDGGWSLLAHHASLPLVEPQDEDEDEAVASLLH